MKKSDVLTRRLAAFTIALVGLAFATFSASWFSTMSTKANPALYFEIPVLDMQRAMKFYQQVFGFDFRLEEIHGNEIAFLPFEVDGVGVSGSPARGEVYQPSLTGTLIYLRTEDVDATLKRAQSAGAKILFPKTRAGEYSYVAEIQDSEGNRIGLMHPLR